MLDGFNLLFEENLQEKPFVLNGSLRGGNVKNLEIF